MRRHNLGREQWTLKSVDLLGTLEPVELDYEEGCWSVNEESPTGEGGPRNFPTIPLLIPLEHQTDLHALLWEYQEIFFTAQ